MNESEGIKAAQHCYVCRAPVTRFTALGNRFVVHCGRCKHSETIYHRSAPEIQQYGKDYYHVRHRRWFQNVNSALHVWILKSLANLTWQTLLDVGAGTGMFLRDCKQAFPERDLCGIDVGNTEVIDGVSWQQIKASDFQPKSHYDVVVSLSVLENYPGDVSEFINDIKRFLKPNGYFFVSTINNRSSLAFLSRLLCIIGVRFAAERLYSSENRQSFSPESLNLFVENNDLVVDDYFFYNQPFNAIDTGIEQPFLDFVVRLCIWTVLEIGRPFGASHLQLIRAKLK